jgi:glutaredoxin 3
MKEALVWSKDNCPHCVAAKHLLKTKGYDIEERIIGLGPWTKEQLLESVPSARSVPQIFLDDNYIGGYTELKTYFEEN